MSMRSHDLARALLNAPDLPVDISTDVSTGDESAGDRAFGKPYCIQWDNASLTICAEGSLNFNPYA